MTPQQQTGQKLQKGSEQANEGGDCGQGANSSRGSNNDAVELVLNHFVQALIQSAKSINTDHYSTRETEFEEPSLARGPVLLEYWQAITERWWVVAIVFLLAIGYGGFKVSKTKPLFAARSVIIIEPRAAQVMRGLESVDQTDPRTLDVMNTMVETIHGRTLLRLVVDSLNLQDNLDFLPPNSNGKPHSKKEALDYLFDCMTVKLRKDTRLVDITVQHPNAKMAAILADAIANEFIKFGLQERITAARNAAEFLSEEAGKYREKLQQSELALDKYRETNNATSLESDQNFVLEQLKALNARLDTERAARFTLDGDYAKAQQLADNPEDLVNIPGIAKQPSVSSMSGSLAEKEASFAILSQQYKSKHPKHLAAAAEINGLRNKFRQTVSEAVLVLGADCKAAKENEERLAKAVAAQQAVSMELDRKAIDYNMLKREAEANRAMYDSMVSRMKEIDVTGEIDSSPIKFIENAVIPDMPIAFNKVVYMLTSALLGLFLGGGIVMALMRNSPFLTTAAQIDRQIGVPVLGTIPAWKPEDGPRDFNFFNSANHSFTEAFRSLRAGMLLNNEREPQTFLVTSAVLGEGKTFISCNLGVAFAQTGMRTLLIDADLRKRTVSRLIFGQEEQPGLAEFLEGRASFEEILRPTGVDNYFVITAGKHIHKPAELLRKNVLQPLIDIALKSFERIIVDTPPVLAVSDALILARDVDAVCLAVRSGKSHRQAVTLACDALAAVGKRPSGVILNAAQEWHGKYRYYAYSRYHPSYVAQDESAGAVGAC